jgi:hypothetical protein
LSRSSIFAVAVFALALVATGCQGTLGPHAGLFNLQAGQAAAAPPQLTLPLR